MSRRRVPDSEAALNRIRQAASLITNETSLRKVARDVGMSPTGLSKFMDGAQPYARTYSKLRNWYVRRGHRSPSLDAEGAWVAIRMLTAHLPDLERAECQRRLLQVLAETSAGEPPAWIAELLFTPDSDREQPSTT